MYDVTIDTANPDQLLVPGVTAIVNIDIDGPDALNFEAGIALRRH